jgi:hypothetical protein
MYVTLSGLLCLCNLFPAADATGYTTKPLRGKIELPFPKLRLLAILIVPFKKWAFLIYYLLEST